MNHEHLFRRDFFWRVLKGRKEGGGGYLRNREQELEYGNCTCCPMFTEHVPRTLRENPPLYFAHREKNHPPKYLGNESEIAHLNFITPQNFAIPPT